MEPAVRTSSICKGYKVSTWNLGSVRWNVGQGATTGVSPGANYNTPSPTPRFQGSQNQSWKVPFVEVEGPNMYVMAGVMVFRDVIYQVF